MFRHAELCSSVFLLLFCLAFPVRSVIRRPEEPVRHIDIAFHHFWRTLDIYNNPLVTLTRHYAAKHNVTVSVIRDYRRADLLFVSVFGKFGYEELPRGYRVLFTGENLRLEGFASIPIHKFDFLLAFHESFDVPSARWPLFLFRRKFLQLDAKSFLAQWTDPLPPLESRTRNTTFVARSNHGPTPGYRTRLLAELKARRIPILCPATIGHNMPYLKDLNLTKGQFLSRHVFNICPENSVGEGYVTEKIFDAIRVGAIPIYFGNLLAEDREIVNINRTIIIRDASLEAMREAVARLRRLLDDPEELDRVYHLPRWSPRAEQTLEGIKRRVHRAFQQIVERTLIRAQRMRAEPQTWDATFPQVFFPGT